MSILFPTGVPVYRRPIVETLFERVSEEPRFIQVLVGPRQTGKTTLTRQIMEECDGLLHYATADGPTLKDHRWLKQQWNAARMVYAKAGGRKPSLLVVDEVQKIAE